MYSYNNTHAANHNRHCKTYTNALLKKEVKAAFTEELKIYEKWHVIPMDWFDKWKLYVNYDNDLDETNDDTKPGVIDTSALLIGETGQLKKTNVPNKDYVLLPNDCAEELYSKFRCTYKIVRETVNNGTTYAQLISVEMFPIRIGFHVCTKDRSEPGEHEEIEKFILCSSKLTCTQLLSKIKQECRYDYYSEIRLWLRDKTSKTEQQNDKRKLTTDITDVHNGWRFLRNATYSVTVNDLADGQDYIEAICEVVSRANVPTDEDWPRFKHLTKWLQTLQVGDHVDIFCRKAGAYKFLEAEITEVDNCDLSAKVHFRAFDDSYDQIVKITNSMIKPLFTETTNWREDMEEDQEIELKEDNKWVKATIVDLNLKEMQIKVSYSPSPSVNASSIEDCDDLVKKATSTSTDVVIYQPPQSEKKMKWIDIESDDICELYTHLTKPAVKQDGCGGYGGDYNKKYRNDWAEKSTKGKPVEMGAVGLKNLGNTCFMNSILQCLSNTPILTDFFTGNKYKDEINLDNPLGHNGKVAQSYGKLMKELWGDAYSTVVPRDLKDTIGEFQPQFAGYQQQDSQELLQFLLDGLHEDLNRVKKKPFTSTIESKGRTDDLISRESWRRYLLRNDSKIVDHCFGQYKSHVTCTNCQADSVNFEAFNILNLPIPVKQTKEHEVSVRLLPLGSPAYKVKVEVGMYDSVHQFKQKVLQKLISCQVLNASDVDLESNSEPPTAACQTKQVHDTYMEEGWDIVYSNESKTGSETPSCSNVSSVHTKEAYNQHIRTRAISSRRTLNCFQVASMSSNYYQQCSINKNHAPNDGIYNANAVFVLFEVESPCSENKPTTSYDMKGFVDANAYTSAYDVIIGKITETTYASTYNYATSYNKKFENITLVNRLVCTRDSTWKDVDKKIWQMVSPYIKDSTHNSSSRLYSIHVGSSYAHFSCQFKQVSDINNDLVMNAIGLTDVIYVVFEKHAIELLDLDGLKYLAPVSEKAVDISTTREESALNIYKCLDKFCEREQLEATETLYCSNCKQHNAPIKKFDLWATPDVLMVQLKRFLYVPGQYFVHREKISDLVNFPIEGLDLSSYLKGPIAPDNPPLYDLYAVSLHSGGLGGGHYTAMCKNSATSRWFNFNDSFVSSANASDAVTASAYVLFYKRRNASVKWAGIKPSEAPVSDE